MLISTQLLLTLSQLAINPLRSKQNQSKRSRVLFNIKKSIAKYMALQLIPANLKLLDSPKDVLKTITITLQNSLQLSALVVNIADQVVKRREKAIIQTLYLLEQLIIQEILVAFSINACLLTLDLAQGQKSNLIKNFNTPGIYTILIASYTTNGTGLNLQQACYNVHLFDPAPSASAQEQAVGRSYCLGQSRKVTIVKYYMRKTFNKRVVNNQILRALPSLIAIIGDELITRAFGGKSDKTPYRPVNATFNPTSL